MDQNSPEQSAPITSADVFRTPPSLDNSQQQSQSNQASQSGQTQQQQAVAQAIAELDKMEKFKFRGQELTPAELEKAMLRQSDYTKKTQELSKSRESFEQESKFQTNLAFDLLAVKQDPNLASKFLQVYPQKYHQYLKSILGEQEQAKAEQTQAPQRPQFNVEYEQRMQKLEKIHHEQEVARYNQEVDGQLSKGMKAHPSLNNEIGREIVLARMHEITLQNENNPDFALTPEMWENSFKQAAAQFEKVLSASYGEKVKKQTEANKIGKDVDQGGVTPGRAPAKFGKIEDVRKNMLADLKSRGE